MGMTKLRKKNEYMRGWKKHVDTDMCNHSSSSLLASTGSLLSASSSSSSTFLAFFARGLAFAFGSLGSLGALGLRGLVS